MRIPIMTLITWAILITQSTSAGAATAVAMSASEMSAEPNLIKDDVACEVCPLKDTDNMSPEEFESFLSTQGGTASYYCGKLFDGKQTACGHKYNRCNTKYCAVPPGAYHCGTPLNIHCPNGKTLHLKVDDFGPGVSKGGVDLSPTEFKMCCGKLSIGRCKVTVTEGQ